MAIRFRKPDSLEFTTEFCEPQLNFLAHAQTVLCDLGSECGGHGVCGQDRIRILKASGEKPILSSFSEAELRHLSQRERDEGWRLACQVFPETQGDELVVEVLSARNIEA